MMVLARAQIGGPPIAAPVGSRNKDIKNSLCPLWGQPGSFTLGESSRHQECQGLDHLGRLPTGGLDRNRRAGARGQHHQSHDRGASDRIMAASDPHLGVKPLYGLHEFGGGASVEALFVADFQDSHDRWSGRIGRVGGTRVAHLPVRTRLAMVTYLRPASWAACTASWSGHSSRTLASFTSMGRLMPAITSTCGRLMTEMARFDGVPPNMSVRMATPSPLSTRLTASMMSLRHCSTSSSGPIVTASICCCGPTTCSNAERNSTASRPCVTRTSPIIEFLAGASRCTARMGTILTILCPCARAF